MLGIVNCDFIIHCLKQPPEMIGHRISHPNFYLTPEKKNVTLTALDYFKTTGEFSFVIPSHIADYLQYDVLQRVRNGNIKPTMAFHLP